MEVGLWMDLGGAILLVQSNHKYHLFVPGSQNAAAKRRVQKENSPDRNLRSPILCSVEKDVRFYRQPGCLLGGSNHLKSA